MIFILQSVGEYNWPTILKISEAEMWFVSRKFFVFKITCIFGPILENYGFLLVEFYAVYKISTFFDGK